MDDIGSLVSVFVQIFMIVQLFVFVKAGYNTAECMMTFIGFLSIQHRWHTQNVADAQC